MRNYISPTDFSPEESFAAIDLAMQIKQRIKSSKEYKPLNNIILAMIFEKSSTRTRLSFEAGVKRLGGETVFLSSRDIQLGRGETIEDTARVVSRYCDVVMIRTFEHKRLLDFAKYSSVPVINGLSDLLHPCQSLSDIMTIKEHFGKLNDIVIAYVGDGNNMANSLLLTCAQLGIDINIATPIDYGLSGLIVNQALDIAKVSGSKILITDNPKEAVNSADVIYTDVWASMGQEGLKEKKHSIFKDYQVNAQLCESANSNYIFMHCLPAHRGEEVAQEIIDGPHSLVFEEAENRLYVQMAIIMNLLKRS